MARLTCYCGGRAVCKLCGGTKVYQYVPGPRGWMPFRCPTCEGAGLLPEEPGEDREKCPTCRGTGTIDPADPPSHGIFDVIWKALFGA